MNQPNNRLKYKGKTYNKANLKKRLRHFVSHSENFVSNSFWYVNQSQWIKDNSNGLDMFKAAGIFAALSPQASVPLNEQFFIQYMETGTASHTAVMVDKCHRIMNASDEEEVVKILNGNKIKSFYLNLLHPNKETKVTIDRHAIACLFQSPNNVSALSNNFARMTDKQYSFFESVYIDVSNELNILAHELQAIAWVSYRQLRNLN